MLVCVDTIYVDSLFALNLIADYLLLLVGARVSGAVLRRARIAAAAVVGAAYSVAVMVPEWGILSHPVLKIALGVGMCVIAYGAERRFWRCTAAFFAVSALFGGAVWASGMLAGTGGAAGVYIPVSWRVLVLSFGICYAAVSLLFRQSLAKRSRHIAAMEVTICGKSASLRVLEDTGSALTDPVTGRAVIVADSAALSRLLGVHIPNGDAAGTAQALSLLPGLEKRVTLIPYRAVGTSSGLLAALRPDALTLDGRSVDALIALGEVKDTEYEAIAPETLF